jgi:4-hydroxy-4-methyl-2-oxoglutarate aldolase
MIGDAPLLTIRRNFPRPAPTLLTAFAGVPTGFVVDALGGRGALDYRIKPVVPIQWPIVGTAVTSENGPADNLALWGAIDVAKAGDILVAGTDSFMETAITGDLLLGMARNKGTAAFVTDGAVRDLEGILGVGMPVFCAGITPNSPARNGPGSVGLPVVIGGVAVNSGDIIVADMNGVVVVPLEKAPAVVASLADVKAAEAALEARVKAGLTLPDFARALLDSDRVHRVD